MSLSDLHVHTHFSSDSDALPEGQIERAIELGMRHIAITDHQDHDLPPGGRTFLLGETGDTDAYVSAIHSLQDQYRGKIEVLVGVELGLQPHLGPMLDEYAASHPFDFIIGSTHRFEGRDTEEQELYEGRADEESARRYFETEFENLRATQAYDVVGHLDFVLRDLPSRNENFRYETHADVLDAMLLYVIEQGKGIECNTATLYRGYGQPGPDTSIIRRYRELGGEIITFGSDAHRVQRLGMAFDEAKQIVQDCGFRHYCIYRNRRPVFLPL